MNATPSTLLRSARSSAGLSVRALAALSGVSPNTVMDIEKGRTDPGVGTLARLLDTAGFELRLTARRRTVVHTVRLADLAAKHHGEEPDWTAVRGVLDWLREHPSQLPAAIQERPAPTRQAHLDALLAGIAEKLADDASLPRPSWTKHVPPAEQQWAPTATPRMLARWKATTPRQLRERNLVVDAESLWRREPASA